MQGKSLALMAIVLLAGCANVPHFTPVADNSDSQVVQLNNETGNRYVLSAKLQSRVAVEQAQFAHRGATFNVKVISENAGTHFGPTDITASQGGKALAVLGKTEMERVIKETNEAAQRHAAMAASISALQGALASRVPASSAYAANAAQQVAATQQSAAVSTAAAQQASLDSRALSATVAKTHLAPINLSRGQALGGLITVPDAVASDPLEFNITVGKERHVLRFVPLSDR